ncbi:VEF-2 [Agrotis segetum nucleopolyhedrovirus A]|uniref:VEF-2 n=1 Tax=Agrotis segetum nuclear polyhedrosis virus TaxID=1962501 RepID=Q287J6_NPVAS|nr:VEF-2 [Agrotis segetum nucleopolyhedrovirus A]AAZ38242.1 VEF-2 [Agrotis segetum nucleopolyhedrovirus A]
MNEPPFVAIPFVDKPTWVPYNENFLAVNHYKKPFPYLMKPGSSIQLSTNHPCTIHVLNDDRDTEQEQVLDVNNSETRINITKYSIVFINCIFVDNNDSALRVSYSIEGEHDPLVHIMCGQNTNYANGVDETLSLVFVEGDRIQLLVPRVDLPHLNDLIRDDPDLLTLNNFYNDVIGCYDELAGISFKRKYFAKADINGPGDAFYHTWYMGESYETMKSFYLTPSTLNWGALHEMAHSFDIYFARNTIQVSLQEVWTNIWPDYYQYTRLTTDEYEDKSWMLSPTREVSIGQLVEKFHTTTLHDWDHRERLLYLTAFFYKVGHKQLLTTMFDILIHKILDNKFRLSEFRVIDLIIDCCNKFNVDVCYVNKLVGVREINPVLLEEVKYNFDNAANVYEFLVRPGVLSMGLIDSDDSVQNDANLVFRESAPNDLIGAQYSLLKAENTIYNFTFTNSKTQLVPSLRAGCYKFISETGNSSQRYRFNSDYVVFNGVSMQPAVLNFEPIANSILLNDRFTFFGLGDVIIAYLTVDYSKKLYSFDVVHDRAHAYFPDEIYFSVKIENSGETDVLWEVIGVDNNFKPQVYEAPLKIGQTLVIYHREPPRLYWNVNTFTQTINRFYLTTYGLVHEDNDINTALPLVWKILDVCQYLTLNYPQLITTSHLIQDHVYLAYRALPSADQSTIYAIISSFLPNTSVTSITAMGSRNQNVLRVTEQNGRLLIVTYESNTPNNTHPIYLVLQLMRARQIIFSTVVYGDLPLRDSFTMFNYPNTTSYLWTMTEIENKRIVVIDGVLQQPRFEQILYKWQNNTFKSIESIEALPPVQDILQSLMLFVVGVTVLVIIIIIIIVKFLVGANKCAIAETIQAPPPPGKTITTRRPTRVTPITTA